MKKRAFMAVAAILLCIVTLITLSSYQRMYNELSEKEELLNSLDLVRYEELIKKEELLTTFDIEEYKMLKEKKDFFYSYQGQRCVTVAFSFFRSFILADVDSMKMYSLYPESENINRLGSYHQTGDFGDVTHLILKGISIDTHENVGISFEFAVRDEGYSYISISLKLIDDEWKVSGFGLEK